MMNLYGIYRIMRYSMFVISAVSVGWPLVANAQNTPFAGKTLRFIVASTPGGGYDIRARTVAKYIGRYLPGTPNLVTENMPGGGSVIAMNYLNGVAPKDGTVILMFMRSLFSVIFDKPDAAKFDFDKLAWVGNMSADNGVIVSWHTTSHKIADDLFKNEIVVAMPAGTIIQPGAINFVLGTKMKIITGYAGAPEMQTALERGEVMGLGEVSWSNLSLTHQDWIQEKKINILFQIGLKKSPELPNVPLPQDYAKTAEDRQILDIVATQRQFAYPIALPPGVPKDRELAWQKAFMSLGQDNEFMSEMKKLGLEFEPTPGDELAEQLNRMTKSASPQVMERLRKIASQTK
jgi:tripartite-type tricarboxylate transporter receptor subunit TctC